ncbi:MAG: hypothetical protein RXR52_19920 [Paraburkholderia sp.]|uniref:T6SS immunity protein Tli3 family protein n=1 Tax=Burkholderiaceae TaxID=119060 RepID=UPI002017CACA|nr:hypothetical protein [Burkholderia sp. 4M9327F10]
MVRKLIALALSAAAVGCAAQQPWSFNLGDFLAAKELPYDSPPQVIYRIDDHRFVTLEHYRDCNHGETFYNDTKRNIRKMLGIGYFENFQGKIINADPSGNNIALPVAFPPRLVCGDRGCTVVLFYSTDGGENFHSIVYMPNSFDPYQDSKAYTIIATNDSIYINQKLGETTNQTETDRYPMIPGFVYFSKEKLPAGKRIEFDVQAPTGLRTPSGQDHITCDTLIRPTNPDVPLNQDN